jgi:signal transduction histidine kinase
MTTIRARLAQVPLADLVAVALGIVLVWLYALTSDPVPADHATRSVDALAVVLLAAACATLLWRRRFPAAVAVATLVVSYIWYSADYTSRLVDIPTIAAFYSLGTTGDRRRQVGIGGLTIVFQLLAALAEPDAAGILVRGTGWTVAAILCGELVNSRRLLIAQYAERASRAEAERDAEAERRVAEERMRIARDVHDVLAHTVSVMTVQAGVAADALDRDSGRVRSALATIRSAGKEAMAEVRATVAVLRGSAPAETTPTPGLDRVTELVDGARAQGLDVDLVVDLDGAEVETLVGLTAYRLVQEGLTNVVRHAGASRAGVAIAVRRDPSQLVVEITDDGRADDGAHATAGFGLRGMGERVDAVGGDLSYGPALGGGWRVWATLPIERT